jgi:4-nitrophenyl phosphatase
MELHEIRNLILDLDGVLWRGDDPIVPLPPLFDQFAALGICTVMATNNASKTPEQYLEKFDRQGVTLEPWQIVTSAETTGNYLADHYPPGSRAFVLGAAGLVEALQQRGFVIVNEPGLAYDGQSPAHLVAAQGSADIVVVGFTPWATYTDFALATWHIRQGAAFIGSNPDVTFPSEIGPLPGAGALLALVQAATDVRPRIIGKPGTPMFREALRRLGGTRRDTVMVGDRLSTDIAGARKARLVSALLLSGVTSRARAESSRVRPDFIFENIADMVQKLHQARQQVTPA